MVARMCIASADAVAGHVWFDTLLPAYDYPQTAGEFRSLHQTAALTDIEVVWGHNGWEGRGMLPRDWRE